jgi:LysM repeat protein
VPARMLTTTTPSRHEPAPASARVPAIVGEVLRASGEPLDAGTRETMGAAFGFDFGQVRVHTDARASASARAVDAAAYTVGSHVVLRSAGPGTTAPAGAGKQARSPGWRLLAHELAHVVQQRGLPDDPENLELGTPGDGHERQADAVAATVAAGGPAPRLAALPSRPRVQRQVMGDVRIAEGEAEQEVVPAEQGAAGAGMGEVLVSDALRAEVDRVLAWVDYQVREGETLATVAKRFGISAEALQRANGLRTSVLHSGQRLKVPASAGCAVAVPSSLEAQVLAGAIFAEASPKAASNDEREAIAWAFVNSARHVQRLCNRELQCPGASDVRMRDQCEIDRASLGRTIAESVQLGSVAYDGPRWKLVMTGVLMLPPGNLCLLPPSEVLAVTRAIEAAGAVLGGSAAPRDYLRFNRAANSPPNPKRQEKAGQHEGHTFYRFKPGSECG